jgi:hypothetical protein
MSINQVTEIDEDFLSQFETVKHVTLPLLQKKDGDPLYIKCTGKIFKADPLKPGRAGSEASAKKEPPYLMEIINLADKRPYQIIVNEVLRESLNKAYPNDSYVDRLFSMVQKQIEGKKYKTYEITEIKLKTQPASAPDAKPTARKTA